MNNEKMRKKNHRCISLINDIRSLCGQLPKGYNFSFKTFRDDEVSKKIKINSEIRKLFFDIKGEALSYRRKEKERSPSDKAEKITEIKQLINKRNIGDYYSTGSQFKMMREAQRKSLEEKNEVDNFKKQFSPRKTTRNRPNSLGSYFDGRYKSNTFSSLIDFRRTFGTLAAGNSLRNSRNLN